MRRKSGHRKAALSAAPLTAAALIALLLTLALLVSGCGCGAPETTNPVSTEAVTSSFSSSTQPPVTAPATSPVTQSPPAQPPSTTLLVKGAPGSSGSGDPYFPTAGNGGYEVQSYAIALDIDPVSGRVTGDETVVAGALQDLSAFNLDLRGLTVADVQVDGVTAPFERRGDELAVTSPATVRAGVTFTVVIRYSGIPETMYAKQFNMGWQRIGDTIFTIDEPLGAATWFAVNDTPADKATYTFSLTVPAEYTATANGVLTGTETAGASRTFHWRMDQPMSSYLAQVAVDRFTLETSTSAGGVPIRNYFAEEIAPVASKAFARTGDVLDYYASLFGPYPFPVYGSVVPDAASGAAMENQTLSLYGRDVVEKRMLDPVTGAIYLSHELAHQWFGNSVTLERWDDIWLNEGFATYASWLWLEHDLGPQALLDQVTLSEQLVAKSLEPPPGTPGPDHLFGTSVYRRGALTLHALRLTVGDEAFFGILRAWADAYEYGTVETAEFITLVKERAPQVPAAELDALFQVWLYGEKVPALPGAAGSFAN